MAFVSGLVDGLGSALSTAAVAVDLSKSALSGALDIVAVRHADGTVKSTPFHVRFGKLRLLNVRANERVVRVSFNGASSALTMRLGDAGDAFFIHATRGAIDALEAARTERATIAFTEIRSRASISPVLGGLAAEVEGEDRGEKLRENADSTRPSLHADGRVTMAGRVVGRADNFGAEEAWAAALATAALPAQGLPPSLILGATAAPPSPRSNTATATTIIGARPYLTNSSVASGSGGGGGGGVTRTTRRLTGFWSTFAGPKRYLPDTSDDESDREAQSVAAAAAAAATPRDTDGSLAPPAIRRAWSATPPGVIGSTNRNNISSSITAGVSGASGGSTRARTPLDKIWRQIARGSPDTGGGGGDDVSSSSLVTALPRGRRGRSPPPPIGEKLSWQASRRFARESPLLSAANPAPNTTTALGPSASPPSATSSPILLPTVAPTSQQRATSVSSGSAGIPTPSPRPSLPEAVILVPETVKRGAWFSSLFSRRKAGGGGGNGAPTAITIAPPLAKPSARSGALPKIAIDAGGGMLLGGLSRANPPLVSREIRHPVPSPSPERIVSNNSVDVQFSHALHMALSNERKWRKYLPHISLIPPPSRATNNVVANGGGEVRRIRVRPHRPTSFDLFSLTKVQRHAALRVFATWAAANVTPAAVAAAAAMTRTTPLLPTAEYFRNWSRATAASTPTAVATPSIPPPPPSPVRSATSREGPSSVQNVSGNASSVYDTVSGRTSRAGSHGSRESTGSIGVPFFGAQRTEAQDNASIHTAAVRWAALEMLFSQEGEGGGGGGGGGGGVGESTGITAAANNNNANNSDDTTTMRGTHEAVAAALGVSAADFEKHLVEGIHYTRSLMPSPAQLRRLPLKWGANDVTFEISSVTAGGGNPIRVATRLFLWEPHAKIVVSDVDGTITKSDVLGHFFFAVGRDWTHAGVAQLYSSIKSQGYNMLYLTSRAIGQTDSTKHYLQHVKQGEGTIDSSSLSASSSSISAVAGGGGGSGNILGGNTNSDETGYALPDGPVLTSPDRLFTAFTREVILRKPQEFKIRALSRAAGGVASIFPPDVNPFAAGFGNRDTDVVAYSAVGVPAGRIFIVNPKGELRASGSGYTKTYASFATLVQEMFPAVLALPPNAPAVGARHGRPIADEAAFTDVSYWKPPLWRLTPEDEESAKLATAALEANKSKSGAADGTKRKV